MVHRCHGGELNAQLQRLCARGLSGHVAQSALVVKTLAAYRLPRRISGCRWVDQRERERVSVQLCPHARSAWRSRSYCPGFSSHRGSPPRVPPGRGGAGAGASADLRDRAPTLARRAPTPSGAVLSRAFAAPVRAFAQATSWPIAHHCRLKSRLCAARLCRAAMPSGRREPGAILCGIGQGRMTNFNGGISFFGVNWGNTKLPCNGINFSDFPESNCTTSVFPERDPCFQTRGNSFLVLFSG